jgi:prepilin-type N-terminal cleavage/methylation domain-containing protein
MNNLLRKKRLGGFTLIELVIVLAVASLLFAGLWRLLSGANSSNRINSDADTIRNLMQSIHRALGSTEGKNFLTELYNAYGPSTVTQNVNIEINLPASNTTLAGCQADTNLQSVTSLGTSGATLSKDYKFICLFLDRGIDANTSTSFNQKFRLVIQNPADDDGNPATIPSYVGADYTLVVRTTGGDPVPDTSGGQLASLIGGSGGFIYSDTDVCTFPSGRSNSACGAYGSWAVDTTTFNISGESGRVFARGKPPSQSQNDIWLARKFYDSGIKVGVGLTEDFNTLQTAIHMNGSASFNLWGSSLNLQDGKIVGSVNDAEAPAAGNRGTIENVFRTFLGRNLDVAIGTGAGNTTNRVTSLVVNGPEDGTSDPGGSFSYSRNCGTQTATGGPLPVGGSSNCAFIASFNGNTQVSGLLQANVLYAQSFVYETTPSDMRFKSNIQPLAQSLNSLMKIDPVSYIRNSDEAHKFGLIAQNVEQVYPELVKTGADGYKGVDYNGMIAPIIGAIQELKHENNVLREELSKQQKELKTLRAKQVQ